MEDRLERHMASGVYRQSLLFSPDAWKSDVAPTKDEAIQRIKETLLQTVNPHLLPSKKLDMESAFLNVDCRNASSVQEALGAVGQRLKALQPDVAAQPPTATLT